MGRGQATRQVLPLLPLIDVSVYANSFISLALFEGGELKLGWGVNSAILLLHDAEHSLLDTSCIPLTDLPDWLRGMEGITVASDAPARFGHFEFSWNAGETALCAYTTRGGAPSRLGTVASWDALYTFLEAARDNHLF